MKLSRFFVIALLAGTLGAFGCSDDPPSNGNGGSGGDGAAGSGGTGGGAADPCTGGFCDDPSEAKTACGVAVDFCKSPDCCGDGVDPTDGECDAFGEALCTIDFGGTGGTGGAGGDGGTDPADVCAECDDQDRIGLCTDAWNACQANPPSGPPENVDEKCAVIALSRCGI